MSVRSFHALMHFEFMANAEGSLDQFKLSYFIHNSLSQLLAQHVRQDAAVAEVFYFVGRIDP